MDSAALKNRTRGFAIAVARVMAPLLRSPLGRHAADQGIRSSASVAANYRAACRARSKADFIAKMGVVEEEADESDLWLSVVEELGLVPAQVTGPLRQEATELTRIAVASINTARGGPRET